MAIRNKQIQPDQMYSTVGYGDFPVISRDALESALVDLAGLVDHLGGTISLVVERHPTDLPGEMVTIRAVATWQDFVRARAQPEPAASLVDDEPPLREAEEQAVAAAVEEASVLPFEHPAETEDELDEDVSEIPAGMR